MDTYWNNYYTNTPTSDIPWNQSGKTFFTKMFSLYPTKTGKSLDIGCGTGNKVKYLRTLGFDAYGIDISSVAVQIANDPQITVGDVEDISSIPHNKYTLITDLVASQFAPNRHEYVKLINEILDSNGLFILSQFYPAQEALDWVKKVAATEEKIREEFSSLNILEIYINDSKQKPCKTYIMKHN